MKTTRNKITKLTDHNQWLVKCGDSDYLHENTRLMTLISKKKFEFKPGKIGARLFTKIDAIKVVKYFKSVKNYNVYKIKA